MSFLLKCDDCIVDDCKLISSGQPDIDQIVSHFLFLTCLSEIP